MSGDSEQIGGAGKSRKEYRRDQETPQERYMRHRVRYLPSQLERARLRVLHLEREAARFGMHELLAPTANAARRG